MVLLNPNITQALMLVTKEGKAQYIMEDAPIEYQITYASEEYEYDS